MPPSICTPQTLMDTQQFVLPLRQAIHLPQLEIRNDGNCISFFKSLCIGFFNQSSQFMTQHPGILKIGLRAFKSMQVGTANANALNAKYSITFSG